MSGHVYRRCPKPVVKACEAGRCEHRWAYTFSFGSDPATGRRRQYTGGGFRTKVEAERAQRAAQTKAEKGELVSRAEQRAANEAARQEVERSVTVAAYAPRWLARKAYRPNTYDMHAMHIKDYVVPAIGSVPLAEVTKRHVRELLEGLAEGVSARTGKPRTKATIARVRATVTKMLEDAVDDELLDVNPARGVKLPERAPENPKRMAVLTPDEIARFDAECDKDPLGPLYGLVLATGLRRGEVVALRWADVELDTTPPVLVVRHAVTQRKGPIREGTPKTKAGTGRRVALDPGAVDLLRAHRRKQASQRLAAGPAWSDLDLVFCYEDGTMLRPDLVTRRWTILCKRAGVQPARLHDGRHTFASRGLDAGVPSKVMADLLGHSSTRITEDIYQHTSDGVAADAAERIAAKMRPAKEGKA